MSVQPKTYFEPYEMNKPLEKAADPMLNAIIEYHFHPNCWETSIHLDTICATDLRIFVDYFPYQLDFAKRIRNAEYLLNYGHQFTMRPAELNKILAGYGDYMIYGFINAGLSEIVRYTIINLDKFRNEYDPIKHRRFGNKNGMGGIAFNLWQFRKSSVTYNMNNDIVRFD